MTKLTKQGPVDVNVGRQCNCSWMCQSCGEHIGWLGRALAFLPWGHKCPNAKPGKPKILLEAGQQWVLSSSIEDGSPWPVKRTPHPVTIAEVQNGWVRYGFGGVGCFSDERMEKALFKSIYRPVVPNAKVRGCGDEN